MKIVKIRGTIGHKKPRVLPMPTRVQKSKKLYNRKGKQEKVDDE